MPSLRARLLSRATGVLVITFVVAALSLYHLMRAALVADVDAALVLEARALASHVEKAGDQVHVELDLAAFPEYSTATRPHFFQIRDGSRQTVARSPSLSGRDLDSLESDASGPVHAFLTLPDGRRGREVAVAFHPRLEDDDESGPSADASERQTLTLIVARPTTDLDGTLGTLRWMLLAVTLAAAVGSVTLTSGVIRRELIPLQDLARSIERVGVSDLSQRIAVAACPEEVVPVVQRLNDLLGRLDEALTREKSFTADAAHELRTPLAGLETTLEVCASRPRDVPMYQDVILKCLHITHGLHGLVNNLLILARADARQLTTHREPVELGPFLRDCWSAFETRAGQKRLDLQWEVEQAGKASIDREKTRVVLTNLFDNAVSYADDAGRIRVAAAIPNGDLSLTIANSGCRLNPADAARVFDRFWRGDQARSEAGLRSGVGLSLCRKIVELLGGTITATVAAGDFTVTVNLPNEPADKSQSSGPKY